MIRLSSYIVLALLGGLCLLLGCAGTTASCRLGRRWRIHDGQNSSLHLRLGDLQGVMLERYGEYFLMEIHLSWI